MLCLSRKKDEAIVIGDNITVCVGEIRGDKVRLFIDAPLYVPIHRQEVYDAIHRDEVEKRDNQPKTTDTIPAASMAPEYRKDNT